MVPPKQYYLSATRPETLPDDYARVSVGDWHLVFDAAYDSIPVVSGDECIGRVVGTVLDAEDELRDGELGVADGTPESFENGLSSLGGRYVGILDGDETYAYTDPAGALPLVYEPTEGVAGTRPAVLPNVDADSRFRSDLFDRISYDADNIWLPGTLTYYEGVERLLPNHRLDLETWTATRFWPRDPEDLAEPDAPVAVAESVAARLREIFDTIVSKYSSPLLSLTAGKDTRMLAAGARPWLLDGAVRAFTYDSGERYDVDVDTAWRMSSDHGFDWWSAPVVSADETQRRWWLEQTGHAVGGTILDIHPTIATLDADVQINGFGGEIARGYYWADGDAADMTFDAPELLDRLHLPVESPLENSISEWYAGVSAFDTFSQLDLMYQELRLGCWAGPHHPAMTQFHDFVGPLYHRKIVDEMYRLPVEVRRNDTFPQLVVDRLWPELNEYPYTAYDDWRDRIRTVKELRRKITVARTRPVRAGSYLVRQLLRN